MLMGWPATTKPARARSGRAQRVAKKRSDGAPGRSTVARALPCAEADANRLAGTAGGAAPNRPVLDTTVPFDVRLARRGSVRRARSSAPVSVPGTLSWVADAAATAACASAARWWMASSWVVPWVFVARVETSQPKAINVRATRAAPKNVSRSLKDTSRLAQAVAESTDGLDQPGLPGAVQLSSQIADVDRDHVVIGLFVGPHGAEQLVAGQHKPRMPQEVSQQLELPGRQWDDSAATAHLTGFNFQGDVGELQDRRWGCGASQERADTGQQLGVGERLDEVVVGAGVEPAHPVGGPAAGGQHQDRQAATGSELAADLQAVD